jgi:hypothetical protein
MGQQAKAISCLDAHLHLAVGACYIGEGFSWIVQNLESV